MTGVLQYPITAGRWDVLNSLSCATFAVRNLGVKTVRGSIPIREASVHVDPSGQPVAIDAVLDLAAIDTGNARRDRDLAKPQLLGTAQHPTLTFHGEHVRSQEAGWTVSGRIDAHGTSVPVDLEVHVVDDSAPSQLSCRATTSFDRSDLGVRAPRFMIGRRILVTVDVVLRRPTV